MKSRLLVAAVGIPFLLWAILWAPVVVLEILILLLSGIGAYELMKCVGATPYWSKGVGIAAAFISSMSNAFGKDCFVLLLMGCMIAIFAIAVWRAGEVKWHTLASSFFALGAIPYALSAFLRLNDAGYHRAYLLLPLIFSFASDSGAFFAGLAFGKHKLAPKVSPKKTVEGAIGGLLGNAVGALIFALVVNRFLNQSIDYTMVVFLGVLCSVVAQLGDLSFSLIKREFGIKDYGTLFLAHGGVLDRFDSVIFVAPVLSSLMIALM